MKKTYKIYCFDIDNTICDTKGIDVKGVSQADYENAKPFKARIARINRLYKKNTIYFFTARGSVTGIDWSALTKKQLKKWGVKYDKLFFGKPYFDVFVDDKAYNDKHFFGLDN